MNSNIKLTLQTKATKTYNDFQKKQRPLSMPIHPAVNFEAESSRQLGKDFRDGSEMVYQRFGHPTSRAAADKIALLEGAESALVFGSGMGAISTTLMALAGSAGSHVVAQREIFAQTFTFLNETLRTFGVETTFVNVADLREVRSAIGATTKLVYIESPSNPLLRVADIAAISAIAQEAGVPVLIDSTFASPYLQNPISLGASVVLHSATKFLAGHSDVMCGAAAGRSELIAKIGSMQRLLGTVLDSHASWLLLRGIKFQFKGGFEAATKFVDALQLIPVATSLGGVESVIEIPFDIDWGEDQLGTAAQNTGIAPGLVRLSVGIEDMADLLDDLRRGFRALRA